MEKYEELYSDLNIKINNIENEVKLAYTISYSGMNCPTPTLYLYNYH